MWRLRLAQQSCYESVFFWSRIVAVAISNPSCSHARMFEAMKETATKLGLVLHPTDPGMFDVFSTVSLSGTHDGVKIVIERLAKLTLFSTHALIAAPMPTKFAITHE